MDRVFSLYTLQTDSQSLRAIARRGDFGLYMASKATKGISWIAEAAFLNDKTLVAEEKPVGFFVGTFDSNAHVDIEMPPRSVLMYAAKSALGNLAEGMGHHLSSLVAMYNDIGQVMRFSECIEPGITPIWKNQDETPHRVRVFEDNVRKLAIP